MGAQWLTREDVPADVLESERRVATEKTTEELKSKGKPEAVIEKIAPKIVEGRLGAFYKETVLLEQAQLSGINGVEWDAVEMPSQFMENWAWNYDTLKTLSAHVDTGEVLPKELFDKMLAAKNFQSGMFCLRQLEFALFDLRIHDDDSTDHADDFQAVLDNVRKEVAVVPAAEYSRFAQSFAHIFAGGYSAGYYSYKWAEVLSADAFSAFEEEGLFNPATGKRWVEEVLSRGSSRDAIENFRAFRGRDPSIEPLLRHSGIV